MNALVLAIALSCPGACEAGHCRVVRPIVVMKVACCERPLRSICERIRHRLAHRPRIILRRCR